MTQTLVGQPPTDNQELAKQVRSHAFVDGPTRKLVRSWIQHDPPPSQVPWTPLAKPLSDCRVALVSSAGIARHDQPPSTSSWSAATPGGATRAGDPSRPPPPRPTSASTTCTSTPVWSPGPGLCTAPAPPPGAVRRRHRRRGRRHPLLVHGLHPPATELLAATAPAIAARMAEEAVDVAVLVPV